VNLVDRMLLDAPGAESAKIDHAWRTLSANRPQDGTPAETAGLARAAFEDRAKFLFADLLPLFRELRVFD
jgi:hypothetical protein